MKSKFFSMPRRVVGCVSLVTLLVAPAAHAVNPAPATWPAGDAVRGKATYRNLCAGCHLGGDSTLGIQNISLGAGTGGQSRINSALLTNKGGMGFLEPTLTAQDLSDINAYLSNPSLSGIAASSASVTPSNVIFQPTEVGSSNTATVTFAVAGGAVMLSSMSISPSIYTLTGGSCTNNLALAAGGTCTALVTFTPTQSGSSPMGTLTFAHNASSSSSTTVSLSGSGTAAPVAVVSQSSLAFAATANGTVSAPQVVMLTNTGNAPLNLSSIAVSSPSFRIAGGTCSSGMNLAASAQCTVLVSFAPSASGAASGNLTLRHNSGVGGTELTSSVALSGLGATNAPAVVLSPSALAFTQMVGTTSAAPQTVTVSNQGSAAANLAGVSFQGLQGGEFARTGGSCASTLAAGASCTITVAFTPAAAGSRTGTLALAHGAVGSPATVTLSGQGTGGASAALASNTEGLVFAPQGVSSTSSMQTVTLTNTGNAALTFTTLGVAGPQMADFLLGSGSCSLGTPLAAGASCTVSVASRPVTMGHKAAHLVLASNAANGTVTLPLMGRGLAVSVPVVSFSPGGLDMGNATVNGAAVTRVLRLTNTGGAALTVSNIGVAGLGITQTNNCGGSVAAGASCNITVSHAPTSAAVLAGGRVTLTSNAAGSPHSVALTGAGVTAASPVLSWATAPDGAFTDTAVGGSATVKTFTLNNAGPGAATISNVQALGAQQGEFVLGGSCLTAGTVAAAGSCTVTVGFAPALMGGRSALLYVGTPGASPMPVALSGRGVALAQNGLTTSVTSLVFPATAVGSSAMMPLSFTNSGSMALALSSLTAGNSAFGAQLSKQPGCTGMPLMMAPGQTCALEVTYRPANANALSDNLTLNTNTSPAQVALSAGAGSGGTGGGAGGGGSGGDNGSSGGGCALAPAGTGDPRVDPTLWLLCLAAVGVLWRRMAQRG